MISRLVIPSFHANATAQTKQTPDKSQLARVNEVPTTAHKYNSISIAKTNMIERQSEGIINKRSLRVKTKRKTMDSRFKWKGRGKETTFSTHVKRMTRMVDED